MEVTHCLHPVLLVVLKAFDRSELPLRVNAHSAAPEVTAGSRGQRIIENIIEAKLLLTPIVSRGWLLAKSDVFVQTITYLSKSFSL